jgi:endo-1,3(4)-beta-glucanase
MTSTLANYSFSPKDWIDALIRDYANPNEHDSHFPHQRHQDDYAGHSWASGLSAITDGQNEQSSSEAVNAYYALALYAKAMHDETLYSWGQFLTARELVSAQTYWQVRSDSSIYSAVFKENNWVVANLWANKVDANAYFNTCTEYRCGLEYSFGIEMLPLNAISLELLDKNWLQQAYPTIKKIYSDEYGLIPNSWRWLLVKGVAKVMPQDEKSLFFQKAAKSNPQEYDNGDSKTNTLYFLSNP